MKGLIYPSNIGMTPEQYAEFVVKSTYGDTVSVRKKAKPLNKFGRTANADSGVATTVSQFQGTTVVNETFVTTNLIDSIVSSSGSDTMSITIEGHTIDGSGNLTFSVQTATLNGQTEVTLATPLARANRAYVTPSGTFNSTPAALVGNVSVYDNTAGITSGVPNTAAATKLVLNAGQTQSQKCQTAISSADYWFIDSYQYSITGAGPNAEVNFQIESRDIANGGVWRPFGPEISLESGATPTLRGNFEPFRIVPPNHDLRVIATASAANTEVSAEIEGVLASIQ